MMTLFSSLEYRMLFGSREMLAFGLQEHDAEHLSLYILTAESTPYDAYAGDPPLKPMLALSDAKLRHTLGAALTDRANARVQTTA